MTQVPHTSSRYARRAPGLGISDSFTILLLFLLPAPSFLGNLGARVGDALRFMTTTGRLTAGRQCYWGNHVTRMSAILVSMFLCSLVSMACGPSHTIRDGLDVFRLLAFWSVFLFGASLARRANARPESVVAVARLLLFIGGLNAAFSLAQYLLPFPTRPLQYLYCVETRHIDMLPELGRAIGFFGNPNTNGVMLLLLSLPALVLYQVTQQQRYILYGAIVFASVILAGSKTGLVLAVLVAAGISAASGKLAYIAFIGAVITGGYFLLDFAIDNGYVEQFPYVKAFLYKIHDAVNGEGLDLKTVGTYKIRLMVWEDTMAWFYKSPIIGSGPLRRFIPSWTDNYYIYLLSRYGIIGLTHYILFAAYGVFLSLWAARLKNRILQSWGLTTFATLLVVNVANQTIDAFLIIPIATLCLLSSGFLTGLMDQREFELRQARRMGVLGGRPRSPQASPPVTPHSRRRPVNRPKTISYSTQNRPNPRFRQLGARGESD